MSDPVVDPAPPNPPASAPPDPAPNPAKPSLEGSLATLDEQTRAFVLGEVQSARTEAKKLRERVKEAEPIVSQWKQLQAASATEQDKAVEAARAEASTAANARILRSEVKAAAAALGFHDPTDALGSADLSQFTPDEHGDFDSAAITSALKDVLKAKPYLAKPAQTQPPTPGNPGFGTGGVRTGTAQDIANRIAAAETSGDWKTAVALKTAGMFGTSPQT